MANSKEIFSKNIKNLLKKNNISRNEIADALGVKYTTFCDWVKGRTYPKTEYIQQIATYLLVTTNALTDENPNFELEQEKGKNINSEINTIDIYMNNCRGKSSIVCYEPVSLDLMKDALEDDNRTEHGFLSTKYQFLGLILTDDSMEPKYYSGDKIIVAWTGYTTDGDYIIQDLKNESFIFRSIKKENDKVIMYVLNPTNSKRIITKYLDEKEFNSRYMIMGKIKKLERVYDGY